MAGLLASAESMTIGVRTGWGRTLEYPTLLISESDESFSVHLPQDLGDHLAAGQVVVVKAALPSSFVLFETEVLDVQRKPFAHAIMAAAAPGKTRRIPRRQHFRVSAVLPVTFSFERPDARVPERLVSLTATTFDVSSGGVGILINRSREAVLPAPHTDGELQLTLAAAGPSGERPPGHHPVLSCGGRITRIEEVAATNNVRLGVDFRNIAEQQRTEVARFVIAHQLALRRRGVLV